MHTLQSKNTKVLTLLLVTGLLLSGCGTGGLEEKLIVSDMEVADISPTSDAKDVPVDSSIAVTFNKALVCSSINNGIFTLKDSNINQVTGSFDCDETTKTLKFMPAGELSYDMAYTATVKAGVEDSEGNTLASDFSWSFTTESPEVASVEIRQTGLLLTKISDSHQLSAVVKDVDGKTLNVPVTWTSTRADVISVDSAGKTTAESANGSSQIIAEARGVKSAPLLGLVTTPIEGAILLTDDQIIGEPVESDPEAPPSFFNTYKVTLTGIVPPVAGDILINTESKPVAGRVVDVVPSGGQSLPRPALGKAAGLEAEGSYTVTLELVSIRELFPDLSINETIDLSQAPIIVNEDFAADYDVVRTGNKFTYTPRSESSGGVLVQKLAKSAAKTATPLPPFSECEIDITGLNSLPIKLSGPPAWSITQNFSLDLVYTPASGLERFVVKGAISTELNDILEIALAFDGTVSCEATLFTIRIPVGGPASLLVGGLIPVKAGFEAGGKVTVAAAKVGVKAEAKAEAEIGIACPNGSDCAFVRSVTGDASAEPILELPSLFGNLRFEPSIEAFGKVELAIGNPFLKSLRFEAFEAQLGPKLEGSFAFQEDQIADKNYESDYGVSFEAKAGVGSDLGGALKLFGLTDLTIAEFGTSIDIAKSPAGAAVDAVTADKPAFNAGDTVLFHVKLDTTTVDFYPLLGPYNVDEVILVRRIGNASPVEAGRVTAASGQTEFDIPFTAPDSGTAGEFTAFVVTTLLPFDLFSLEVGSPDTQRMAYTQVMGVTTSSLSIYSMKEDGTDQIFLASTGAHPDWSPDGKKIAFTSFSTGDGGEIFVMNADGSGQTNLTQNPAQDQYPAWSPDGTKIAFSSSRSGNSEIFVMNADGTGLTLLATGELNVAPSWSPDGTKIVFHGGADLFVVNSSGGGKINLTNNNIDLVEREPAWSPDGSKIIFAGTPNDNPAWDIYIMNAGGGAATKLTNSPEHDYSPAWSPDGSRIAFTRVIDSFNNVVEIHVMNADGSGQTMLIGNGYYPVWSPK